MAAQVLQLGALLEAAQRSQSIMRCETEQQSQREKHKLQQAAIECEGKIRELTAELSQLQEQSKEQLGDCTRLQATVVERTEESETLQLQVESVIVQAAVELKSTKSAMQEQLQRQQQRLSEAEQTFLLEAQEMERQLVQSKQAEGALHRENEQMQVVCSELRAQAEFCTTERSTLEGHNADLSLEKAAVEQQLRVTSQHLEREGQAHAEEVQRLQDELEHAREIELRCMSEKEDLEANLLVVRQECREMKQQMSALQQQAHAAQIENTQLGIQSAIIVEEKDLLTEQLLEAKHLLEASRSEAAAQLQQAETECEGKISELTAELSQLQEQSKEQLGDCTRLQATVVELASSNKSGEEKVVQLEVRVAELEAAAEVFFTEKTSTEEQLAKLEQGLADATQYAKEVQEELVSQSKEMKELNKQNIELVDDRLALEQQLSFASQELETLQHGAEQEQRQMETVNMKLSTHNADLADERTALEAELRRVQQQLQDIEQSHRKEWQQREAQLQHLDQGFRSATHLSNDLKMQLESWKQHVTIKNEELTIQKHLTKQIKLDMEAATALSHRSAVVRIARSNRISNNAQRHSVLRQWVSQVRLACVREARDIAKETSRSLQSSLQQAKMQLALQEASNLHNRPSAPQHYCDVCSNNAVVLQSSDSEDTTVFPEQVRDLNKSLKTVSTLQGSQLDDRAKSTSPRLRREASLVQCLRQDTDSTDQQSPERESTHSRTLCLGSNPPRAQSTAHHRPTAQSQAVVAVLPTGRNLQSSFDSSSSSSVLENEDTHQLQLCDQNELLALTAAVPPLADIVIVERALQKPNSSTMISQLMHKMDSEMKRSPRGAWVTSDGKKWLSSPRGIELARKHQLGLHMAGQEHGL